MPRHKARHAPRDGYKQHQPPPPLRRVPHPGLGGPGPAHPSSMPAHVSPGALRLLLLLLLASWAGLGAAMRPAEVASLRREVVDMFYHGYDNYMEVAFPEDEVRSVITKNIYIRTWMAIGG